MPKGLKEQILNLRRESKTYNEIAKLLKCSKSVVSFHCVNAKLENIGLSIETLSDKLIKEIKEYYLTHSLVLTSRKFKISRTTILKYCDSKRIVLSSEERRQRKIDSVTKRRRKIKEMAIAYKGGKCERCNYNKCNAALEFHHTDPDEKDFSIGNSGHCKSWEKVKQELDKCILVCSNCHREIHDKLNIRIDNSEAE